MKKIIIILICACGIVISGFAQQNTSNVWPDGTPISAWFSDKTKVKLEDLGKQYVITDFGVVGDSTLLQTVAIQKIIDDASAKGGGVVIVPKGTFLSGALFFKPNTHLHLSEGAVLKGSDDITHYPKMASRMEGQNLDYFPALVNVYGVDGFTLSGTGTLDGNGLKFWQTFWQRIREDRTTTNLDVSRPRLLFVWDSDNVQVQDVKLHNTGFWTSHYYKCNNLKILDVHIFSPHEPVPAPSSDAIDIDVCSNVLISGSYLSVNDDAIALKGGKGPWADEDPDNGSNTNILIEDSEFGYCHAALTCGSESIHNRNILMRNIQVNQAARLLRFKMRPDTPQNYEYMTVENIQGNAISLIYIKPWTQFFDLKGREDIPISYVSNITMRNIDLKCNVFFDVDITKNDKLSQFTFEDLRIEAEKDSYDKSVVDGFTFSNVKVNGKLVQ